MHDGQDAPESAPATRLRSIILSSAGYPYPDAVRSINKLPARDVSRPVRPYDKVLRDQNSVVCVCAGRMDVAANGNVAR